ncbi:6,7-dimethyl-8-ribityllumazine synthase [candidate division KSB1 bacterium]|nr:6,7-dimethyl-8-ribityllumazine synthase [candidate division KSB1 bacterium]
MTKVIEGQLSAKGKKFAIVVSRFNELICKKLLEGALDCLKRHGANLDDVTIAWVPGSFEIPVAARRMARTNAYDAVICLGAVIRGATPHFEFIASEVTKGIAMVSLEQEMPVSYGVITPDSLEQALERAGTKSGNKGWDAALSAIEMADLFARIKS